MLIWISRPATIATRLTGETRKRSITPLSISKMIPIPFQPPPNSAIMITTPGVTYDT